MGKSSKIDFKLYVITSRVLCPESGLEAVIRQACHNGVKAIQLREKDLPAKALFELGRQLKSICHQHAAKLLINDRIDVAKAVGADGVQLTARSLPVEIARPLLPASGLIGVSTHSVTDVEIAQSDGADFILFGPVYETPSKIKYGKPQGLAKLQRVVESVKIPVFAVGGINPERAEFCLQAGASGVAVISEIMQADNLTEKLLKFEKALGTL